jgi:hypothetical protein
MKVIWILHNVIPFQCIYFLCAPFHVPILQREPSM